MTLLSAGSSAAGTPDEDPAEVPSVGWAEDGSASLVFSNLSEEDASGAALEVVWLEDGEERTESTEGAVSGGEADVSDGLRSVPDGVQAAVAVVLRDGTVARSPIRWVDEGGTRVLTDEEQLAATVAVLAPAAHAATANARFCVRNNLLYVDDAVTAFVNADYLLNGSTTNPARGFRVRVQRLGTPPLPNPDFDGSTEDGPGSLWCTPVLSLVVGAQYAATVYSEGDIASESFTVNKTVLAPAVAQHVAFVNIPAVPPAYYTVTTPATEDWHIAAVMSWSLYHNDTYTSGQSYVAFSDNNCGDVDGDGLDDPCCDDHTSWTSCNSGGLIYYKHAHTEQRYTIAHELGHRVASLANGGVGANTDDTRSPGTVCPGADAHRRDHWEWSSMAANEGFAHYWADVTMNDVAGADCVSWSHDNVNWDLVAPDDGHVYDCDGPPVVLVPPLADADWVGDVCAADLPVTNTANEYDYQRFFWDMTTDGGMDTYDVLAVWDAADPHLWTNSGAGSGAGYPYYELQDAAAAYSGGTYWADWVGQSIVNGVYR